MAVPGAMTDAAPVPIRTDQIKKGAGTVLDKTDIDDKIKDKVEGIVDKFKMGKKDDDTQNA